MEERSTLVYVSGQGRIEQPKAQPVRPKTDGIVRILLKRLGGNKMVSVVSGLDVAEEDTSDLLKEVQKQLKMRERGKVMRLEVEKSMSKHQRTRLAKALGINESALYVINGPLNLTFLSKLVKAVQGHEDLNYPKYHA